jgi:hypothetical protein
MRLWVTVIAIPVLCSVGWSTDRVKPDGNEKAKWWVVPDVDEQPGDKIEKIGRQQQPYNASRGRRRTDAAKAHLIELRIDWSKKTPEELIGLLCSAPAKELQGVSSVLASEGNQLIFEALLSLGEAAKPALRAHANDPRIPYTDQDSVGKFCNDILAVPPKFKFNRLVPRAGAQASEAEVSPGLFVRYREFSIVWELQDGSFSAVHTQPSEKEKFYQKYTTYLEIPWQRRPVYWVGVGDRLALRAWEGRLYLIVFDRETDFERIRFRYYRQKDDLLTEIAANEFPKAIASQNLWLRTDNGTRADGTKVNEVEIAKQMDPEQYDFRESLTAKIWLQCETGKEYYEMPHDIDRSFLQDFRKKYGVVRLTTIQRSGG